MSALLQCGQERDKTLYGVAHDEKEAARMKREEKEHACDDRYFFNEYNER